MDKTMRTMRSTIAGLATAFAMMAGGAQAQDVIIDAATGQPIQLNGISDAGMSTLRDGGQIVANTPNGSITLTGEIYIPGTWIDPDGCEHWVMDDGIEGYMAPKLSRDGYPTCNGGTAQPSKLMVHMYDTPMTGKYGGKW